jgi:acetyl esterase/lipase
MTATWKLPALRTGTVPTPSDLLASRRQMRTVAPPWAPDSAVTVRQVDIGGVSCVLCEPPDPRSMSVYFHGGGYRQGAAAWSTPFATRLARSSGSTVVVVEYRLAPEDPFPAGLHDATAVYGQLLDEGHQTVIAAGDSAGGGLAAALVVAAAMSDIPLPAGLVLMSAWLDLTCTARTYETCAKSDELFSLASAQMAAELYLQGEDPRHPLVSPALASIDAWPPALVLASTGEVLLQDSLEFTSAVALGGGSVTAVLEHGRHHAWPAVFPDLPESASALSVIGAFYAQLHRPGGQPDG